MNTSKYTGPSKSFLRILLGNLSIIALGLLISSFLVFRGLDCFVAMLPERSAYFNPFMITSSELRLAISDPLSILVFISVILPTFDIPIISAIRIPLLVCFWLLSIFVLSHLEKVKEQVVSCMFFSLEMLLISQALLGWSNEPIAFFLNMMIPVVMCLGVNLLLVPLRNERFRFKVRAPRLSAFTSCFMLLFAAIFTVSCYGEIWYTVLLHSLWFLWILSPGILIWRAVKKLSGSSNQSAGVDVYMSSMFGVTYTAFTTWMLLELGFFGLWQLVAFQLPFWLLLAKGVTNQSILRADYRRDWLNRWINRDFFLHFTFVCLLLLVLSWLTGWFSVDWNRIPWNDAWIFWGRGYQAASLGRLFPSWLFLTSGSGVTPSISSLFASIFIISPCDRIASILFVKIFSLVLVFFTAIGVYFASQSLISHFWKDAPSICSAFASLVYLSSSWTIMYSYYFVRELLGTTVFLSVLILASQEIPKQGRTRLFYLTFFSLLGNLLYYISPLTWLYFLPIFAVVLMSNMFHNSTQVVKSSVETSVVMCTPLLPIVYERLVWLPATTAYLSAEVLSSVHLPWKWVLAYLIVNSSGFLVYLISLLGMFFLFLTMFRLREWRASAVVTFPVTIILVGIFLPFSTFSLSFRYSYILAIAEGLLASVFLAWLIGRIKKTKSRVLYQKLFSVMMGLLIVSQISYSLMHSTLIDKRSDNEVIDMLQLVDQHLPSNYTIVVDSFDSEGMLYKATGLLAPRNVVDWSIFREFNDMATCGNQLEEFVDLLRDRNIGLLWVDAPNSFLTGYVKLLLDNLGVIPYHVRLIPVGKPAFINADSARYNVYTIEVTSATSGYLLDLKSCSYAWELDARESYNTRTYSHRILSDVDARQQVLELEGISIQQTTDAWITIHQDVPIDEEYESLIVSFKTNSYASLQILFLMTNGDWPHVWFSPSGNWTTKIVDLKALGVNAPIEEIVIRARTNTGNVNFSTFVSYLSLINSD